MAKRKKKKPSLTPALRPSSKFGRVLAVASGSASCAELGPVFNSSSSLHRGSSSLETSQPAETLGPLPLSSTSASMEAVTGSATIPLPSGNSVETGSVSIPLPSGKSVEAKSSCSELPESKMAASPLSVPVCESSTTVPISVLPEDSASMTVCEISSTVNIAASPDSSLSIPVCEISSTVSKQALPHSSANPSYAEATKSSQPDSLWASKFKASLRNLKQMDLPTFMEDGTPVVVAPSSVLLKAATMWKGHLVAQFHGLSPTTKRIFTDLNPIWGRFGNITVRTLSETAALIFIPSLNTRQWVLDVGFWHAGNCSCTVYPWSPDGPLELEELQTAPTWAVLRNVPPQLYSLEGISVIASGIGEPLHTEKSWLDPVNIGVTKVKVVIKLDSPLPETVVVKDVHGNSARVAVEYPRPPPKCLNCGRFGHLLSRCPKPLMKKLPFKQEKPSGSKEVAHPAVTLPPPSVVASGTSSKGIMTSLAPNFTSVASTSKPRRKRSRSKRRASSTPPRIISTEDTGIGKRVVGEKMDGGSSEAGRMWVMKPVKTKKGSLPATQGGTSDLPSSNSLPLNPEASRIQSTITPRVLDPDDDDRPKVSSVTAVFPLPPGHPRQRVVRSWIASNKLLVGGFLETHVAEENAASVLASTLPGWRMDNNYCCSDLGRIWIVWDPSVSVLVFKKSQQMILCSIRLPGSSLSFAAAFVYGLNTELERRFLWDEISSIANTSPLCFTPWILLGDYNQIAATSEHYSVNHSSFSLRGIEDFQDCLRDNDLADIPNRGVFYTWSNHQLDNPIIRKLDRAVGNGEWFILFPTATAVFDPPGDSDHSPCIITLSNFPERSKKSFKYFSFLATHPTFMSCIASAWDKETLVGSKMFLLGEHLSEAKKACRSLNRQGFSNLQQRTSEALASLEDIQSQLLSIPSDSLFRQEHVARKKWDFFAAALESFFRQKSRIRWLKEGDANTRFFHRAVLAHHAKNLIKYLRGDDDSRVENVGQLKDMIVSYYSHLLGSESQSVTPFSVDTIRAIHPFRCDDSLSAKLSAIPTVEEITLSVFSMPKNKAPGPDGFPVEFFWDTWSVVKDSLISAVQEFFRTGHLLRKFNATAIILIPKDTGADRLANFRPVACCNTIYKIITRIISNRLKLFISTAVQGNQVGFIKGRLLCENVLLASELVEGFHLEGAVSRGCLQIDLTKAYDNVNWDFLINILLAMNLPSIFINWIRVCISTPSYSVAFNGELIGFFQGKKGIRQGDPMSSHLFVLIMDILAKFLDKGVINSIFQPHPKCLAPMITHLSFADDVLVFFDGSDSSIAGILSILDDFKNGSGLGINRQKTALLIDGGDFNALEALSERHGVSHGSFPVRYLGVPLMAQKMRKHDYQPLLDRINFKFSSWTVRHLSFAGRLQLLKSVIYSTINFWISIFILPNQCLLKLEQMCNAFLWKGAPNSARGAKIAWDVVCSSKECGGLGLKRLASWNSVMALKLIWMLFTKAGSLWVSWVRINLIGHRNFWTLNPTYSGSWIWKKLCKLRVLARPFVVCEIGTGQTASFWQDNWTGLGPLIDITGPSGPQVVGMPLTSLVRDALRGRGWWLSSSRSRNPIIALLKDSLPVAENMIDSLHDDIYLWKPDHHAPSNIFSTEKTWTALNPNGVPVTWHKSVWFKDHIPKHAFICWVVAWNRLHTRDRLRSWGLNISPSCVLCNASLETRDHLFFECGFSMQVWSYFTARTNLTPPIPFMSCLSWVRSASRDKNIALIIKLIFQASIYLIWKERNLRIHTSTSTPPSVTIKAIKQLLRARLDPLTRMQRNATPGNTLLSSWFRLFS
ncbi:Reverse transcriptase zinc-binding domain [Arabidopsis thaliana x Arabidopsis arenosa]|uniref:Reverse transcriptase zinc-binding domain n=1 Tax=Arabidopsis thaliana x Arabidopsis arenosa TaxID=1240361 RepID=A0A8T1ZR19_9BRAS|nr:Reverse transcriptase zinc-binding domain [Arabidopsis thaliana x Arabidopsis arenosa]